MGRLFDQDNPIMVFLSKLFDVMVLSIIWLLFCIPLITIGASTTALYYTSVKSIRRDRGYIIKSFWHCFKTNFLQSTVLWIGAFLLGLLMVTNVKWAMGMGGTIGIVLTGVYLMLSFILAGIGVYMFPVLSRFSMKAAAFLKSCLFFVFRHLTSTIIILLVLAASGLGLYIMPIAVFFLPAVSSLLISLPMEKILKKYTPEPEVMYNEDGEPLEDNVPWYLE